MDLLLNLKSEQCSIIDIADSLTGSLILLGVFPTISDRFKGIHQQCVLGVYGRG